MRTGKKEAIADRQRRQAVDKKCALCDRWLKRWELPYTPGDPGLCDECARANPYRPA